MESIFKLRDKEYSKLKLWWLKKFFDIAAKLTNIKRFRVGYVQCLAAEGIADGVEKLLKQEIEKKDGIEQALTFYLEIYEEKEKSEEGLLKLHGLCLDSEEPFLLKRVADCLSGYNEDEKAFELYSRLVDLPHFSSLEEIDLVEVMEYFMMRKSYERIIDLGERLLLEKPNLVRVTYMVAEAYELIGNLEQAKTAFEKMLKIEKKRMTAEEYRVLKHLCNMHLGNIYILKEEPFTALKYFSLAEGEDIDRKEAIRGKSIANFQAGEYESALKDYDILENEFDMKFISYYGKGVANKAMGKMKEAKSWLLQAEELEPENQSVLYNLSHLEYLDENNENALELIDRALELDPGDPDTLYGKAMVYTAMHKYGDALEIFDEVLKKKTESAEIYCRKADALRHLGRLDEAEYNYDIALQKNIGLPEAYYGKGIVLAAKGDLNEALRVMDDTISVNQGFIDAYIGRSMIQMYLNDLEDGDYTQGEGIKH